MMGAVAGGWVYVVAAYGITAVVIVAIIAWILLDHRAQRQALARLEDQGVRRRSARTGSAS